MVMDADGQNVQPVTKTIAVLDEQYYPRREARWSAAGSPFFSGGR